MGTDITTNEKTDGGGRTSGHTEATTARRGLIVWSGAGLVAALFGTAVGHLVAGLVEPAASPVLAVGASVIDLTPTPVKEWAISTFGTKDKPVLIGSVLVGTLLLAAVAGALTRRSRILGAALLVGLVALAAVAALTRPTASVWWILPAVATGIAGVLALILLARTLSPHTATEEEEETASRSAPRSFGPEREVVSSARTDADDAPTTSLARRPLLVTSGLVVGAVASGGLGEFLVRRAGRIQDVALPSAADPAMPLPQGIEGRYPGISPFRTPLEDFYRVDTALVVPSVDVNDWSLTIDGDVSQQVELSFDDLTSMRLIERNITLNCVSNEVGGPYVGSALWLGVPIKDLLDRAGIDDTGADQILSTSVDGFTLSTPLEVALDGRDTMVVVGMDGDQLPRERGFPARLLTPGLYGYVGATKWLTKLTLTTYAEQQAYWTERDWATDAPVKIASRIDTPKALSTVSGDTVIGGVAWAQRRGIGKVEVSVDGGAWQPAKLGPDAGVDYWRQWYLPWQGESGQHRVSVRATTEDGEVQTAARARPFPNGASGIQEIVFSVG